MSDEESFVILGSSPLSSHQDSILSNPQIHNASMSIVNNDNCNSLLVTSAIAKAIDSKSVESDVNKKENNETLSENVKRDSNGKPIEANKQLTDGDLTENVNEVVAVSLKDMQIWAKPNVQNASNENEIIRSVHSTLCSNSVSIISDKSFKQPENEIKDTKEILSDIDTDVNKQSFVENIVKEQSLKLASPLVNSTTNLKKSDLAVSFILGEIDADVLKSSVYSQFPNISMEACAEDAIKLQNLVMENMNLKAALQKIKNSTQLYEQNDLQFKNYIENMERNHEKELTKYREDIKQLIEDKRQLIENVNLQIDHNKALNIANEKDHEILIQAISEKTAIIQNMRAQIETLEDKLKEKQHFGEMGSLKVNLTAAEDLIKKLHVEMKEMKVLDLTKQEKIEELQQINATLSAKEIEQNERIGLLENVVDIYRNDFEEYKQQQNEIMKEYEVLQTPNNESEQRHNEGEVYNETLSSSNSNDMPNNMGMATAVDLYLCPLCNTAFSSLTLLTSHASDCSDNY